MNYKYRVTLAGIKGFFRLYVVGGSNSLYTFHKQLRSDLEFPADQQILFKALDEKGNVVARYALIDLGQGAVDQVTIEKTIKAGAVKFIYFYDIKSKKNVEITLEEEVAGPAVTPAVIESKGPLPIDFENGYVAFEDIPKTETVRKKHNFEQEEDDDDEDEEDDEDEDKEEEEILYDANE